MNKQSVPLADSTIKKLTKNTMLRKCLKTLMHQLLHQFRSLNYDSNGILCRYLMELKQCQQKHKQSIMLLKIPNQQQEERTSKQITYWNEAEYDEIIKLWPEIAVMVWELARSPKWYVEMLKNEEIHAQETQCIDMHVFTTKIYKRVMAEASKMTDYGKLFQEICPDQIYFFLEEISAQICGCFKSGQSVIITELNRVTVTVQKSQIITFYLLYKIFKDTASICRQRICHYLEESLFRNIEPEVVSNFAHYIIEKYEVLDMKMDSEKQGEEKVSITERIINANHVRWREAIRQDGEIGILVELQDERQEGKSSSYMLIFDDNDNISVVNSNSISKQWKVCKKAEENYDILNLVKNKKALAEKMRTTSTAPIQMTLLDNVGVLGGSMGKCLAEIDMYDDVGQFMVSLSKRTIIGGSFNYLLMSVPLLGYVFVTGGFTYTFYYIISNQYANSDRKLRQLRNVTIGSATSIGSSLIGATIGQTLIPVPILGAFIGGLVGGFLGEFGARAISSIVESARFKQTIQQMKSTIQPKGYWEVNQRTLQILEVNYQKFYETIPQKLEKWMNCDRVWLTLIFFTLLCFHESRERIKAMEKKMKAAKKMEKKLSDYELIEANQNMSVNKQYEPSIDFMCVLHFFDSNQLIFIDYHDDVAFLLNKIFTKIK